MNNIDPNTSRYWSPRFVKQGILILFVTVYMILGLRTEIRFIEIKPLPEWLLEDFGYYSRALSSALAGGDPYEIRGIGPAYIYPPQALLVIEPLALFQNLRLQTAVFFSVNFMILGLMISGIAILYRLPWRKIWWWYPIGFAFAPFLETIHVGQINMITQFGLFLLFFAELFSPLLSSVGISLAIITKVSPLLFLPYLAINQRWRTLLLTIGTLLILTILAGWRYGWFHLWTYSEVFRDLLEIFPILWGSYSLTTKSALFGWVSESALPLLQTSLTIYFGLLCTISAFFAMRSKKREPFFIIVNLAMFLSPNIMWYHHLVFFLLPLFIWMGWQKHNNFVWFWIMCGLTVIQFDRYWSFGLATHLFGHLSMLWILVGQLQNFINSPKKGKLISPKPS